MYFCQIFILQIMFKAMKISKSSVFTGDHINIHQSTVSKILKRVIPEIARLANVFIQMPNSNNHEEIVRIKHDFNRIRNFPNVIGCVDGTHIKISNPGGDNAENYRNRHGEFSYNVQAICDADLLIRSIDARWAGSTHDSQVFNGSLSKLMFERGDYVNCYLLGDSAYSATRYLLTPKLNPQTQAERRYNKAHQKTRKTIERTFGVWKRRFPALYFGLRTKKDTTLATIVAAAVLHNIAILKGIPEPEDNVFIQEPREALVNGEQNVNAIAVRNAIIRNHFN